MASNWHWLLRRLFAPWKNPGGILSPRPRPGPSKLEIPDPSQGGKLVLVGGLKFVNLQFFLGVYKQTSTGFVGIFGLRIFDDLWT